MLRAERSYNLDRRVFAFYVNPYTSELCADEITGIGGDAESRRLEALKGQGVTQMGAWRVGDAWNHGRAAVAKWDYQKVSGQTLAKMMHKQILNLKQQSWYKPSGWQQC